jgi:hypothetical protein
MFPTISTDVVSAGPTQIRSFPVRQRLVALAAGYLRLTRIPQIPQKSKTHQNISTRKIDEFQQIQSPEGQERRITRRLASSARLSLQKWRAI